MNIDQFLISFPEFADTDADLVNAKLVEAGNELDSEMWGTNFDAAQGYLAAHKLALSPMGQNARLLPLDGVTTYEKHLRALLIATVPGASVVGVL